MSSKESLYKRRIIILVAVALVLWIGGVAGWYFGVLKPQKEELAKVAVAYQTRLATANRLDQAQKDQKKAEDRLAYLNGQLGFLRQRYRNLYFGDIGADYASETLVQKANRETAWRAWMNTYYNGYGPALKRELENAATSSGVIINSMISVTPPPRAPEEVVPPGNGLLKPVVAGANNAAGGTAPQSLPPTTAPGTGSPSVGGAGGDMSVSVTGTLPNILRYFDRLNTYATLVRVGSIKLDTDPGPPLRVKATFSITPYLLATGPGAKLGDSAGANPTAGAGGFPRADGIPGASPSASPGLTTARAPSSNNAG